MSELHFPPRRHPYGPTLVFVLSVTFNFGIIHACETPPLRCGSQCLYTVMKRFETGPKSFDALEDEIGQPSPIGYSLQQLSDIATTHGLNVFGVNTTMESLAERKGVFTCIANLNKNHFVLVADVGPNNVRLIDPPNVINIPTSTFLSQWDGNALLISNVALEPEADVLSRLWWQQLTRRLTWIFGMLLFVTALAFGFRKWQRR